MKFVQKACSLRFSELPMSTDLRERSDSLRTSNSHKLEFLACGGELPFSGKRLLDDWTVKLV
jgi:hypothetical protein